MNNNVIKYLKPKYVYIPLFNSKEKYQINKYIYKGQVVAVKKEYNIYSPVSGYIKCIEKHLNTDNKIIRYLKIENDYKEKIEKYKVLNNIYYNKESFINTIVKSKIIDYKPVDIKILVINLLTNIDINNNIIILKEKCSKILETIDNINTMLNIPTYILINDKVNNTNILNKYIKSYPNIKVKMTNIKYINDDILVNNIFNLNKKNTLLLNINQIISIDNLLKYNFPSMEKIITIKDNNKELLVNIKIGSLLSEVLDIKTNNNLLVVGSLLRGKSLQSDDLVIDQNIESIYIIKNKYAKENPCIRCGKCISVCPYGISPIEVRNKVLNNKKISSSNIDKCIECGLCSYHCPSKIELVEYIKKAKEKEYEKV